MVGDEVDYYLQTGLVGTPDEVAELLHAAGLVVGKIRVHVVVIFDGIGGTGIPFHEGLTTGMPDYAGVPYGADMQGLEIIETLRIPVRELTFSPDAGKYLVDYFHLLNSDTVIAAAIETFKDSAPPPKDGMVSLRLHSAATASLIPSASFPRTIKPSEGRVLR